MKVKEPKATVMFLSDREKSLIYCFNLLLIEILLVCRIEETSNRRCSSAPRLLSEIKFSKLMHDISDTAAGHKSILEKNILVRRGKSMSHFRS